MIAELKRKEEWFCQESDEWNCTCCLPGWNDLPKELFPMAEIEAIHAGLFSGYRVEQECGTSMDRHKFYRHVPLAGLTRSLLLDRAYDFAKTVEAALPFTTFQCVSPATHSVGHLKPIPHLITEEGVAVRRMFPISNEPAIVLRAYVGFKRIT